MRNAATRIFGLLVAASGVVMLANTGGNQNLLIGGVIVTAAGVGILFYGGPDA